MPNLRCISRSHSRIDISQTVHPLAILLWSSGVAKNFLYQSQRHASGAPVAVIQRIICVHKQQGPLCVVIKQVLYKLEAYRRALKIIASPVYDPMASIGGHDGMSNLVPHLAVNDAVIISRSLRQKAAPFAHPHRSLFSNGHNKLHDCQI